MDLENEQRYYQEKEMELQQVFSQMDRNGDGMISYEEIVRYLMQRDQTMAQEEAEQLANEIMINLDQDGD